VALLSGITLSPLCSAGTVGFLRNVVTPLPSAFLALFVWLAFRPPLSRSLDRLAPYCSWLYAHLQTSVPF